MRAVCVTIAPQNPTRRHANRSACPNGHDHRSDKPHIRPDTSRAPGIWPLSPRMSPPDPGRGGQDDLIAHAIIGQ